MGVILIEDFFAKIFNNYKKNSSKEYVFIIYIFMLLSTFPRWFAYSPITAFKLCIYSAIVFWVVDKLEEIFGKSKT